MDLTEILKIKNINVINLFNGIIFYLFDSSKKYFPLFMTYIFSLSTNKPNVSNL